MWIWYWRNLSIPHRYLLNLHGFHLISTWIRWRYQHVEKFPWNFDVESMCLNFNFYMISVQFPSVMNMYSMWPFHVVSILVQIEISLWKACVSSTWIHMEGFIWNRYGFHIPGYLGTHGILIAEKTAKFYEEKIYCN